MRPSGIVKLANVKRDAALAALFGLGPMIAPSVYTGTMLRERDATPEQQKLIDEILKKFQERGTEVVSRKSDSGTFNGSFGWKPDGKEIAQFIGKGPPGLYAHEYGHAQKTRRDELPAYIAGKLALMLGASVPMFLKGRGARYGTAGGLGLLSVPMLREEFEASHSGAKTLRELGAPDSDARTSWVGLPTYLMSALTPLALAISRGRINKLMGG